MSGNVQDTSNAKKKKKKKANVPFLEFAFWLGETTNRTSKCNINILMD